ncbi:MAG: STAS domain-containing protein [Candidatus Zixiibacteriota bacterium]|nr:MAG: STAS domain-containing protein [candidate division Zixibacteria bacterium]
MVYRFLPFLAWLKGYSPAHLRADVIAGLTVAMVLIPQSMAYAQLADLPAYYGLYAAFLPPLVAALFGSSRQLATGPVAVVSLMTATALAPLATAGSEAFIAYAVLLALLVGIFQMLLGLFRLGMVVNFISHPVVNGFTNAAAIIIATSQLANLLGVTAEKGEHHYQTVYNVLAAIPHSAHLPTLGLALLAFAIMFGLRYLNPRIPNVLIAVVVTTMISWGAGLERKMKAPLSSLCVPTQEKIIAYNHALTEIDSAMARRIELGKHLKAQAKCQGCHDLKDPNDVTAKYNITISDLEIVRLKEQAGEERAQLRRLVFVPYREASGDTLLCEPQALAPGTPKLAGRWRLKVGSRPVPQDTLTLTGGGAVVGFVPSGLPSIQPPGLHLNVILDLLPMMMIISLLGFLEAISIAKAIAARTGQQIDPNRELIGQGLSNIVGSFTLAYPVSGSFSRSAVNYQTGAVTGFSSAFASAVVLLVLLFFTPLLYYIPQAALAAIIMMAVIGLINVHGFIHAWKTQRYDGIIAVITFVLTLAFAPHLDKGIMIGVGLSLVHFLLRNIKPDLSLLSKFEDGTFRDADRRGLQKCRHLAVVRFNNSLIFANVAYLEEKILELQNAMPELRHVHIVCNAINELDASGEETLSKIVTRLRDAGHDVSLSGVNEKVLQTMRRTYLLEKIGDDHVYGNVAMAVAALYRKTHEHSRETACPLLECMARAVTPEAAAPRKKARNAG